MIDIVILSKASDEAHFQLVKRCVDSFLQEDSYIGKIIIVESEKSFNIEKWSAISNKIEVIIPPYNFNYNQFLNIGIERCSSEIICISNSDVQAKKGCLQLMKTTFDKVPTIMSASPVDRTWHQNSYNIFPQDNQIYVGYDTTKFLLGFCIFVRKATFDIIGPFDERFHFYHQDNDYEMCLRRHNLLHVMNTFCHIKHGHEKPPSSTTEAETYAMLRNSQAVFTKKWNTAPYNTRFVKYKKLSIVTKNTDMSASSDYIEIVDDIQKAVGQYIVECERCIDIEEQQLLINLINFKPDSVKVNGVIVVKRF